ncbi:MAG: GxxExxY protein [Ardenticatenaceae bacterium]|nr:GxxExxY protein [Ardenticatenaceae bacterium]
MVYEELTQKIIGCAFKVHKVLGGGYLEKVYENALCLELAKQQLAAQQQVPLTVYYEGQSVGDFIADIVVESCVIVEIKAIRMLNQQHEAQVVNYLTTTGLEIGLLINFGSSSVEIKRKYRDYKPTRHIKL